MAFSCKKQPNISKAEIKKEQVQEPKEEIDIKHHEINDTLLDILFSSRETVATKQELDAKMEEKLSNFSEEAELKIKNWIYGDPPFSDNPRNPDIIVRIDNVKWDVSGKIRVLDFTERIVKGESILGTKNYEFIFQLNGNDPDNFQVIDFEYQVLTNDEVKSTEENVQPQTSPTIPPKISTTKNQ